MKYFKKELWKAFNDDSIPFDKAWKEWNENSTAYKRQLKKTCSKLKSSAQTFFNDIGLLHDGKLLRFEGGDLINFSISKKIDPYYPEVKIFVVSDQSRLFVIRYKNVKRILFDFPSEKTLFGPDTIGDWGYDELTIAGSKLFRHEILFSSGATILVECSEIVVQSKLIEKWKKKIRTIKFNEN
jgi:hypothetical protein